MTDTASPRIPVLRPRLPDADAVLPYLREVDGARWYSNDGPLLRRFVSRLASHFRVADEEVAPVANGTLGLTLALKASGAPPGGICLAPAWSFPACAHAIIGAGLVPCFLDVDAATWSLTPEIARAAMAEPENPAGAAVAVMPVMPFGRPLDLQAWDAFTAETGVPVVVDAAAGFDSLVPAKAAAVVSLHATKTFGVGEGGVVIARDAEFIADVRRLANFGFTVDRRSAVPATNAKLSEYAAAVGLAGFDEWEARRADLRDLARRYIDAAAGYSEIQFMPGFGAWAPSTCMVTLDSRSALVAAEALAGRGIETRRWWGDGCHEQPAFAACPRATDLPVTTMLAALSIGLPFYPGLDDAEIMRIVSAAAGH